MEGESRRSRWRRVERALVVGEQRAVVTATVTALR